MRSIDEFRSKSIQDQTLELYREGTFLMGIRYYGYKVNLYAIHGTLIEVFYNHKFDRIDEISELDKRHSRMKFYTDQIKLFENKIIV